MAAKKPKPDETPQFELHGYNCGAVSSIAVVAFLGIKNRYVSAHGTFMIHKSTLTFQSPVTAAKMRTSADYLDIEDARTEAIVRTHTTIPTAIWDQHATQDVVFNAKDAVDFGIADSIREFQVPASTQLFQV
jgi:ATP-dependent Clp protease, protease subunit